MDSGNLFSTQTFCDNWKIGQKVSLFPGHI